MPTILNITNGLNGYPRFGWVDILRFQHDDTHIQQKFYELGFMDVLLNNMVARHEYRLVNEGGNYGSSYYVLVKDYTRPVYETDCREKLFDSEDEKIEFIKSFHY